MWIDLHQNHRHHDSHVIAVIRDCVESPLLGCTNPFCTDASSGLLALFHPLRDAGDEQLGAAVGAVVDASDAGFRGQS